MLFAGGQDKKTLTEVMRDYRAGLLQKVDIPGIGTAEENCILVNSNYNTDPISPGEIVPLNDFEYFGERAHVSDDEYSERHLFGCCSRCGTSNNFYGFTEDPYRFTPIPFGIAKDFVSYYKYGNVQINGRCWALVENTGTGTTETISHANRFVVVRKNSRYDGKPFLQTAPDGMAEVIYFGRTLSNGLTWALLELGHSYGHTLRHIIDANADKNQHTIFYTTDSYGSQETLYSSWNLNREVHLAIRQKYYASLDNYVQAFPLSFYQDIFTAGIDSYYFNAFDGLVQALDVVYPSSNPGFPTFQKVQETLVPFTTGIFPATYRKTANEEFILLWGNKIQLTNCWHNRSGIQLLDLWDGDKIDVEITSETAYAFQVNPTGTGVHIVNGPKDYPLGTILAFIGNTYPSEMLNRGWVIYDWKTNFQYDFGVLYGNNGTTFSQGTHIHNFSYTVDVSPINSQTDQSTDYKSLGVPFEITLLRKVRSGYPDQGAINN